MSLPNNNTSPPTSSSPAAKRPKLTHDTPTKHSANTIQTKIRKPNCPLLLLTLGETVPKIATASTSHSPTSKISESNINHANPPTVVSKKRAIDTTNPITPKKSSSQDSFIIHKKKVTPDGTSKSPPVPPTTSPSSKKTVVEGKTLFGTPTNTNTSDEEYGNYDYNRHADQFLKLRPYFHNKENSLWRSDRWTYVLDNEDFKHLDLWIEKNCMKSIPATDGPDPTKQAMLIDVGEQGDMKRDQASTVFDQVTQENTSEFEIVGWRNNSSNTNNKTEPSSKKKTNSMPRQIRMMRMLTKTISNQQLNKSLNLTRKTIG